MLKRSRRLRASEVARVIANGAPVRAGWLAARVLGGQGTGSLRAALVVPPSVAKGAVLRNRLRRAGYAELATAYGPDMLAVFFVRTLPPPPNRESFRSAIHVILNDTISFQAKAPKR